MKSEFVLAALSLAMPFTTPPQAAEDYDPNRIDILDALECRLDAPDYNGFAMALNGEEKIADKRRWVRVDTRNPFMNEYELPAPITVAGHYSTRRIAFTSSGVLAILDLADPAAIAQEQGIKNALDPTPLVEAMVASGKATREEVEAATRSRKFLGEKILVDRTEPPTAGESFGAHTIIGRNVSNATTLPGKTFYGCSYRIELIGKDGQPL
ncbi:MAG: hypothetical protein ABI810_06215 [Sphingomonas bacterium]